MGTFSRDVLHGLREMQMYERNAKAKGKETEARSTKQSAPIVCYTLERQKAKGPEGEGQGFPSQHGSLDGEEKEEEGGSELRKHDERRLCTHEEL